MVEAYIHTYINIKDLFVLWNAFEVRCAGLAWILGA